MNSTQDPEVEPTVKRRGRPAASVKRSRIMIERQARAGTGEMIESVGRILPSSPMCARDVVALWEIPQNEIDDVSVVVFRQVPGENAQETICSVPVRLFDFAKLTGKYGPGKYFLRGSAGPFHRKASTILVSDDLARANGYGRMDTPSAQDVHAVQTLTSAAQGAASGLGFDPTAFMAAIEKMVERALTARMPAPSVPDQFGQMETMIALMDRFDARAERRLGIKPAQDPADEVEEETMTSSLLKNGPVILGLIADAFRRDPVPVQPTAKPLPLRASSTAPVVDVFADLPEDQRKAVQIGLASLARFRDLLAHADKPSATPDQTAAQLIGFIPEQFAAPLLTLADVARVKGPLTLASLGDPFPSARWVEILQSLRGLVLTKFDLDDAS